MHHADLWDGSLQWRHWCMWMNKLDSSSLLTYTLYLSLHPSIHLPPPPSILTFARHSMSALAIRWCAHLSYIAHWPGRWAGTHARSICSMSIHHWHLVPLSPPVMGQNLILNMVSVKSSFHARRPFFFPSLLKPHSTTERQRFHCSSIQQNSIQSRSLPREWSKRNKYHWSSFHWRIMQEVEET